MKISIEDYVARISIASPIQLVIINYEIIIDYLKCSKHYIEYKSNKDFIFNVNKAREFLGKLRDSLDMSYEISYSLIKSYNYIDKILAFYLFNKQEAYLDKAIEMLQKLLDSWLKIQEEEVDKTPIMKDAQQIFSGITYSKDGTLNEYIPFDSDRGFQV